MNKEGFHRDEMIFARKDQVFKLNLETEEITTYYKFREPLNRQPMNFDTNTNQDIFIVASPEDALYINKRIQVEIDLDDLH